MINQITHFVYNTILQITKLLEMRFSTTNLLPFARMKFV